ncbi:DUF4856 domain-containing protein [Mucilaginibacter sp. X4EP1]|uniref:DUF4856 domain-containing protein n=1 Tax=Mucilaginibacter sp. X4EP1 TaxID=2723092 RepID=UPI0021689354|nr:DUF4856 domain-containing protein [Mucilaginibacter sp. X4EP1]MCS3814262.1 hypothetical protein [Mucilaginibacter sp. X4EP1]
MKKSFTIISALAITLALTEGCKKSAAKTDPTPTYTVPTTYNFANVNYSDATTRLSMVTEMVNLMNTSTTGAVVDGQRLLNMFTNTNAPFAAAASNTSGIQVKDQCFALLQTDVQNYIDSIVMVSQSTQPASRGIAGIGASSVTPTSKYSQTGNGVNYAQVFKKSIMGGLICYEIVNNYMTNGIASSVDNNTIVAGSGTAMEHNWDLAFGYWGVPINFPTSKTGAVYWGSYTTQIDSGYHANAILMSAFLKGRAAITNKDMTTTQAQATIIMQTFERMTGAAALQEINEIKAALTDNVKRNSALSECYGFVNSLKYNPARKITDAQIAAILALFPKNFWDLTTTDINNIQNAIATQYNFQDVKDIL